jgi:hypothetical protein
MVSMTQNAHHLLFGHLRQELGERTDDLDAARAANHDLMSLANRKPSCPGEP